MGGTAITTALPTVATKFRIQGQLELECYWSPVSLLQSVQLTWDENKIKSICCCFFSHSIQLLFLFTHKPRLRIMYFSCSSFYTIKLFNGVRKESTLGKKIEYMPMTFLRKQFVFIYFFLLWRLILSVQDPFHYCCSPWNHLLMFQGIKCL